MHVGESVITSETHMRMTRLQRKLVLRRRLPRQRDWLTSAFSIRCSSSALACWPPPAAGDSGFSSSGAEYAAVPMTPACGWVGEGGGVGMRWRRGKQHAVQR